MSKDYYKILGVDKSASQDDIKKAFRKLAHQHHPDKQGGDEKKFKEINEAYQVLGKEEKRKQYDQFGTTFDSSGFGNGQGGAGGFNWQDFARAGGGQQGGFDGGGVHFDMGDLGDVFGDLFGFGGGRRSSSRTRGGGSVRGRDFEYRMEIDLKESAFGVEKMIELEQLDVCDKCKGKGYEDGIKVVTCAQCGGQGQVQQQQRTFFGVVNTASVCPTCQGEGRKPESYCSKCQGQGRVQIKKKLKVQVPAGINNGESIKLSGQGEAGAKGAGSGDLYITFIIRPDKKFERQGYDIFSRAEVNIVQAALGDDVMVETLDGSVKLKVPAATQSGNVLRLKNKGTEKLHGRGRGDQLVEIRVVVPEKLSRKARGLLEDLKKEI